jgi:hypothetical protein
MSNESIFLLGQISSGKANSFWRRTSPFGSQLVVCFGVIARKLYGCYVSLIGFDRTHIHNRENGSAGFSA